MGYRLLRQKDASPPAPSGSTWLSQHEAEGVLRLTDEAQMPTGDGNLVEMLATLHFRIDRPRRYLLGVKDPEEILRSNLEGALREAASGESFLDLLTSRRGQFQREAFDRLQRRLQVYGGGGLGVELTGLSLRPASAASGGARVSCRRPVGGGSRSGASKRRGGGGGRLRREAEGDAFKTKRRRKPRPSDCSDEAAMERDAFPRLAPSPDGIVAGELAAFDGRNRG